MPSLLDSGPMVNLIHQNYFNCYVRPRLGLAERSEAEAHNLFDLKAANEVGIPLSRYKELDVEFLGLNVLMVVFLIIQNQIDVLKHEHSTQDKWLSSSYNVTLHVGNVSVILTNTTHCNIWIRQPILAADIYEVELLPWQHYTILNRG